MVYISRFDLVMYSEFQFEIYYSLQPECLTEEEGGVDLQTRAFLAYVGFCGLRYEDTQPRNTFALSGFIDCPTTPVYPPLIARTSVQPHHNMFPIVHPG